MQRFDLFEFYRFLLTVAVATYSIVRTATFIWQWQRYEQRSRWAPLARRYVEVQLLRLRVGRFLGEIVQIIMLTLLFVLLIERHRW